MFSFHPPLLTLFEISLCFYTRTTRACRPREREREREKKKKSYTMAGGGGGAADPTSVKPNQFVELHGHAREVVEKSFRFTPRSLGVIAIFGVAVPYGLYKACVNEFNAADDKYGRERKRFM